MNSIKTIIISAAIISLLLLTINVVAESGEEIDGTDDVLEIDGVTGESEFTSDIPSADITKVSYEKADNSKEVSVSFEVNSLGEVETIDLTDPNIYSDLLNSTDPIPAAYIVSVETNIAVYEIYYSSANCTIGLEGTILEYTVDDNVFTTSFDVDSASETIERISAQSVFMTFLDGNIYMDIAPDSSLLTALIEVDSNTSEVGESIEFNGVGANFGDAFGVTEGFYTYTWDFDDGNTATGETVSHSYDYAGKYNVSLTVEDENGYTTTTTTEVIISQGTNSNGNNGNGGNDEPDDGDENSSFLLFVGVVAIIVVIGIIALVVVIRR